MSEEHEWNTHYPKDLLPYIELFRVEYIPYAIYDCLLDRYLRTHVGDRSLRILSLGCGTGQHEVNLAGLGHTVVGLDKDEESLRRAQNNAARKGVDVQFYRADILAEAELRSVLCGVNEDAAFDVAMMLGVQLGMADHARVATLVRGHLSVGGMFATGLWGYASNFDAERVVHESCIEIAVAKNRSDFAVRLNAYRYDRTGGQYYIDWDAVYLYPGPDNVARIHRRHTDRIEIACEREGVDPLGLESAETYLRLPAYALHECGEGMCFPHTYEYLIGWKKL